MAAPPAFAGTVAPLPYSVENAPLIIEAYAVRYGIPSEPIIDTLKCESGFNPVAIGDKGTSFGVAQIHLPAHPDITRDEALNPFFAIDWTAQQFKAGKQGMWSCYRFLYGSNSG